MAERRIDCVGGIVVDAAGRLLLVLRGREPAKGTWSIPGGRVEAGESDAVATAREVLEETAVAVRVGRLVGAVERAAPGGGVYAIRDYLCHPVAGPGQSSPGEGGPGEGGQDDDADGHGVVRAGDDADDAAWFTPEQVRALETSPGLVRALEEWGVL